MGPRRAAPVLAFAIASVWIVPAVLAVVNGHNLEAAVAFAVTWIGPTIVTTTVVAAPLAGPAIRARSVALPTIGTAVIAIVLSAPIVAAEVAFGSAEDVATALAETFSFAVFGLIALGWLFLLIAIPSGFLWSWSLRRLFRPSYSSGD